jgi:hypothetical protein
MRNYLPLALVVLLGFAGVVSGMTLDEAFALFEGGDMNVPYNVDGRTLLEEAIAVLRETLGVPDTLDEMVEKTVTAFPVDIALKDVVNKLSQAYYTLADAFLGGVEPDELNTYLKGKHWGLKSLRMDADFAAIEGEPGDKVSEFVDAVNQETDIDALYWAAACWLRCAEFNKLAAVAGKVPDQTEAMSLRCLELDDTYLNYGSYRALGAFWGGLPRLGILVHYSKNFNKSLGYFCKVVDESALCAECNDCPDFGAFDPVANEYFENRVFFVEFYLMEKGGLWEDAKRILESVLAEPIGELHPLYNTISQEKAAEFLEEVSAHLEE